MGMRLFTLDYDHPTSHYCANAASAGANTGAHDGASAVFSEGAKVGHHMGALSWCS